MKKLVYTIMICLTVSITVNTVSAQAWSKHTKLLGLGFGASYFFHLDPDKTTSRYYGTAPLWLTGQLNFQGEFGVHDYVGIGFTTGVVAEPDIQEDFILGMAVQLIPVMAR